MTYPENWHVMPFDDLRDALRQELDALAIKGSELREALEEMAYQFAYTTVKDGQLCLTDGGLSALEGAFAALGWESPRPIPERECMADGCHTEATCGTPTPDGYKRLCSKHFLEMERWK